MAVKLQLHKAPELNHMIFRIGEMHTVMTSLRALGTSIEDSGFDDAWVEADMYGPTTKKQILEGNHMKRALTAHSITHSALTDLYVESFLNKKADENGNEYTNIVPALFELNSVCQEGHYDKVGEHHRNVLTAVEAEGLKNKHEEYDAVMEQKSPLFKFARRYMKFFSCILLQKEKATGNSILNH